MSRAYLTRYFIKMNNPLQTTTGTTTTISREFCRSHPNLSEIHDQPEKKILSLQLDERNFGTVEYEKEGNTYHLIHSAIPLELQGRGYGHILAKKTFDYIAENNLRMKIICEFLQSAYEKNKYKYKQYVE